MTASRTSIPHGLGIPNYGDQNGGYWNAFAQAQSLAAYAASAAYQGAAANAHSALLSYAAQYAPSPAIEDAGIRAGEIVGWRMWRAKYGALHSMAVSVVWPFAGPMVTSEENVEHGLGAFAFKTEEKAIAEYGSHAGWEEVVIGTVHLWGLVIEHERGYRAEFARPANLVAYLGGRWWQRKKKLKAIRENYGLTA